MKDPLTGRETAWEGSLADGSMGEAVPLRDFLTGLGPLLKLHEKELQEREVPRPEPEPDFPAGRKPGRARPLVLVALTAVALVLGAVWYFSGITRVIPTGLVGTWIADNPRYDGRMFQLSPGVVTLWTGEGLEQHTVLAVEEWTVADTATYVIRYQGAGAPAEFAFRYVPSSDRILFHHQENMPWHRSASRNP